MENELPSTSEEPSGFRRTWIDHTSELAASAETVFALLRDIDGWPSWTPGLVAIRRKDQGPIKVGTSFTMVLKAGSAPKTPLPCKVLKLAPLYIEWGGGFPGSMIQHRFEITPSSGLRCKVRHVEYATGLLALLTLPIERLAYRHDLAWSRAIERRFAS